MLGNKQLLSVFFIVVVLLGVFFTMGYIVGQNTATVERGERAAAADRPAAAVGAARPERSQNDRLPVPQQPPQEQPRAGRDAGRATSADCAASRRRRCVSASASRARRTDEAVPRPHRGRADVPAGSRAEAARMPTTW